MAELVAVQSGLALFRTGEVGVVIDTQDLNPYDPQPLQSILATGSWETAVASSDVPAACAELADAALENYDVSLSAAGAGNDARQVRVPKNVQDAVRSGLDALKANECELSISAYDIANKLASGTVTVELAKRVHASLSSSDSVTASSVLAFGGESGRRWVAKVCGDEAIVAAGGVPTPPPPADPSLETEWTDPSKPHVYVELAPGDATCALCDLPATDPIHIAVDAAPASAGGTVEYFATFAPGGDEGSTFKVDTLLAHDEEGAWWQREFGEWTPTQAPDEGADLVMLDLESFNAAAAQLDEPGAAYAELSISEEKFFQLAVNELDLDVLDAVFAAAPYVPTEVRSANAKKQMRDAKGHFILQGGMVEDANGDRGTIARVDKSAGTVDVKGADGTVKTVPANEVTVDKNAAGAPGTPAASADAAPAAPTDGTGVVKAHLPSALPLVTDVAGLITQYKAQWAQEKSSPVTAAVDPLIPPDEPTPASPTPTASGPSTPSDSPEQTDVSGDPVADAGVTPLYLAQVDPQDTEAVLELVAVVPSTGEGDNIDVYTRDKGTWTLNEHELTAIQGPTPPPLVELAPDMLANVLDQLDNAPADAAPADATPAPVAATGYAVLQKFSLTAGALTASQQQGARLLIPYGDNLPADIVGRLDELAQGGADQNRGNAERLRHYWVRGEGAAKIRWGEPGDYNRCVDHLGKYMGERAHGYCQLRHKDATGFYAGHAPSEQRPHGRVAALVGEVQVEEDLSIFDVNNDPDVPHEFGGPGPESDLFDGECPTCGRPIDHPIHVLVDLEPEVEPDADVVADAPHAFTPGPDGLCECGKPVDDPLHTLTDAPAPESLPAPDSIEFAAGDAPATEVDYAQPHVFVPSPDSADGPNLCDCGRPRDDAMHVVTASSGVLADTAAEVTPGQKFRIPLVVPEGVESGDGRTFADNSLTSRDMPLALMWQPEGDEGHKGSVIVGRIDHVERTEQGLGNAYGVFDTGVHGQEALRLVRGGMLRGISADLDEFEADVLGGGEDENKVTSTKLMVNSGRLMGITLVAKPAYAECTIELVDEGDNTVADGEYTQDTGEARVAALIASAAPLVPPKSWFQDPGLSKPTHLTIEDDGRVFGHIAAWDVDHIGLPFGTRAPRSASGYAYFRTGVLRTAEGEDVPVGQLTLAGGHAPLQADARTAVKHYDDTASAVCDLAAGEDSYGIWVAGALRPGVTPEQVRALRASSPSGDWRPIRGSLELVAVCQVNVPGFPVARAMVSSGVVTALVAAGALALEAPEARHEFTKSDIDKRIAALEAQEQKRLDAAALALRERMTPAIRAKQEAMTAAVMAARERVDVVRNERKAKLDAAKAELTARVAAGGGLHVAPNFEETKHPRADDGRFRTVLARLHDLLGSDHDAQPGIQRIEDAAGKEDAGDHQGAAVAAQEGATKLDEAAQRATGDIKAKLVEAAHQVRSAADAATSPDANADVPAEGAAEVIFDSLAEPLKDMVREAVTRAEQKLDPANPQEMLDKLKAFITGTNAMDPAAVANFVKNQLKRPFTPHAPTVAPQAPSAQPSVPSPV